MRAGSISVSLRPQDVRQQQCGLGGGLAVARREEARARRLELVHTAPRTGMPSATEPEEQRRSCLVVVRHQLERVREVAVGPRQRTERRRSIAGLTERSTCARSEPVDLLPRRSHKLERARIVMRDRFGVVVRTAERLDPLRGSDVLLGALGSRDLAVRDVADEQVLERKLRLALDGAAARTLHELLL